MFDDRLVAIDHRLEDVLAEIAAALKPKPWPERAACWILLTMPLDR